MQAIKLTLISLFYLFCTLKIQAQRNKTVEIKGRVIEIINGKSVGLPNIKVVSENNDFNVTDPNGNFSLFIPSGMQAVKIHIQESTNKMLTPPSGVINMPPIGNVEILVCRAENKRLETSIEQLNQKMKAIERKSQLEKQNLEKITKILIDSIKNQEIQIQLIEKEKNDIKRISAQLLKENESKIAALEAILLQKDKQIQEMQQQLLLALEEKYLKQQAHLKLVADPLRRYLDALKNLRDQLLPDKVYAYTSNNQAINYLTKKIELYNEARNRINDNQDSYLTGVKHYWEAPLLFDEFQETLNYLLNTVHNDLVLNYYNKGIIDPLFHEKKTGRQLTEKKIKENASIAYPKINDAIILLEEKMNTVLLKLKNHF
jgi:hypothetical protein